MAHDELRELAFQMRSDDLREYAQSVLERDPNRTAAADVLDLMAYLVACDFVGAEAKLETIRFNFKGTEDEVYVNEAIALAGTHISFAFGRFQKLDQSAEAFLSSHNTKPKLEQGEYLDVLRLIAQKALILDDFEKLALIEKEMSMYEFEEQSTNLLYLINSVRSMNLMARGDFVQANALARMNFEIAKQNQYNGLMAPLDSMYVIARSLLAGAKSTEALAMFEEIKVEAEKFSQWPWYFISDGYLSREYALANKMTEALAIVRDEREKLANFGFKHELNFIPDINELYVRHLIKDIERMQVLLERVPNLIIVQQIRALGEEWRGRDMLKWVQELPEQSPREKLYKLVALADYYADKESIAVEYMSQALQLSEETGQVEFILRQDRLFDVILKAIAKKPSAYLEYIGMRITDRVRINTEKNQTGMPVPLTTRELEVVRHLATGKPISAISSSLHVSMNTMKTHLRNVYRKLEVDGRESAVQKAKELFLI